MKIKSFEAKYLSQILEIYNDCFVHDYLNEEEFIRQHIADMNFDADLFLLRVDHEKVLGFLFGIKRKISYFSRGLQENTAWIKLMAVRNEVRCQGIGALLLDEFEHKVKSLSTKRIILAMYSPSYFYSGVDITNKSAIEFFEKHNYVGKEESYWMERELDQYITPNNIIENKNRLVAEGFRFLPFEDQYAYSLLQMLKRNFSDGWVSYVIEAIKNKKAKKEILIVIKNEEVVGYVSRASIDHNESRFGPFGVSEECRNAKLGEVLIHEMFIAMKKNKINHVFFKSTEENGKRFYIRQGMEVKRIYRKYDKNL